MTLHYVEHDQHPCELQADRVDGGLRLSIVQPYQPYGYGHVAAVKIPAGDVRRVLEDLRAEAAVRDAAQVLALLRAEYAELLAHARAAVAAARLGQQAPLALLEGHLEERGQLPEPGARPEIEVARAYAASVDVYALAGAEGVSA
jgi:hypothetical protein